MLCFFNFLKRNRKEIKPIKSQPDIYELTISRLNESKYGPLIESEYRFIKLLFTTFEQQGLDGFIKLTRMSTKVLDFYYDGYPVGKVKLNGRKTWFFAMSNLYDQHRVENPQREDYEELINLWVLYIKKHLL